ncbi:MAG: alkaline phosphatase [Armatimonadetes bacterium]|nr:alkaline phosphatase [Armatimonadota bacterium]
MIKRTVIFVLLTILLATTLIPACSAQKPKNIILMIGDGMGIAQIALTRMTLEREHTTLKMDSMAYTALVKTHSANSTVTDSAAAGTALATGFKTNNGMVGVLPNGKVVQNIREAAAKLGKATGLVTTTTITHATPACFGAHIAKRGEEADIAPQLIENRIDVLLGGGRQVFIPGSADGSKRKDERNLIAEAKSAGYAIAENRKDLFAINAGKLLGLFQMGALTTELPEPSLAEMTAKAIEILSKDKDGFFLMVEGGQIDWKCHANDTQGMIKQLLDFDAAVGKALGFARKYKDTLVVVTADHETGGLSILGSEEGSLDFTANWATKSHTGVNVLLLADGPGAESFRGLLDNTDVPKILAKQWGIKGFAITR